MLEQNAHKTLPGEFGYYVQRNYPSPQPKISLPKKKDSIFNFL